MHAVWLSNTIRFTMATYTISDKLRKNLKQTASSPLGVVLFYNVESLRWWINSIGQKQHWRPESILFWNYLIPLVDKVVNGSLQEPCKRFTKSASRPFASEVNRVQSLIF